MCGKNTHRPTIPKALFSLKTENNKGSVTESVRAGDKILVAVAGKPVPFFFFAGILVDVLHRSVSYL